MKGRLLIGLTGTFGSGKSTVAKLFRTWGARVIDADRLGHEALRKNTESYRKIVREFGREVLDQKSLIDRKKLASVVFSNTSKRRRLERIIHPYVFSEIRKNLKRIRRGVVVLEVPLLFETGFNRHVDRTVTVWALKSVLMQRLRSKRHLSDKEIKLRIKAQMPLASKKKQSDFLINNSNGLKETAKQARLVWAQIKLRKR